jgi:diguanylate cyclase (GGDEF)-like protein
MAYRYGGEEFVIVLRERSLGTATAALDRIRVAVEGLALAHPDNPPSGVVTISGGIAESTAARPIAVQEWLRRADVALYQAKALGRNRVVAFDAINEAA